MLLSLLAPGCSTTYDATNKTPEDIFARAVKEFNGNDLFESQRLLDIIRLQYPTSQLADDAQYYLAEINYKRHEYILAAYNYNYLRRMYPQSEFAKLSMYKAAQCYVEMSPPYDRDQKYTKEAIVALSEYRERYKDDSTAADSSIKILRTKLSEHDFRIAEQYRTLLSPKASLIYFDAVIDDYADTEFCEPALRAKAEILTQLKRYDEALSACSLYSRFFPNGPSTGVLKELQLKASALKEAADRDAAAKKESQKDTKENSDKK